MKPVEPVVKVPSPTSALDKIKAFVSPKSTSGLLRDHNAETVRRIKEAGG